MKYTHSWAVKMEMQCWEAICTIVYCPLYTLQSIRLVPVKVSQTSVFGFMFKIKRKRGRKGSGDTSNMKKTCLIKPLLYLFLSWRSRADMLVPTAAKQGVSQQGAGGMERPVGFLMLKNKAFNQKCRSSAYLVVLSSRSIAKAWYI